MIQRIQTVYLLLVVALMVATLFLPLAVLQQGEMIYSFDVTGLEAVTSSNQELLFPTWTLFTLSATIILVAFVTIFFFKRRILQIRLSVFNALLMIGFYVLSGYHYWCLTSQMGDFSITGKIAFTFPFISVIFDYLAIRNIGADEALVRSLDRLR